MIFRFSSSKMKLDISTFFYINLYFLNLYINLIFKFRLMIFFAMDVIKPVTSKAEWKWIPYFLALCVFGKKMFLKKFQYGNP